jgi:hypothetical protein
MNPLTASRKEFTFHTLLKPSIPISERRETVTKLSDLNFFCANIVRAVNIRFDKSSSIDSWSHQYVYKHELGYYSIELQLMYCYQDTWKTIILDTHFLKDFLHIWHPKSAFKLLCPMWFMKLCVADFIVGETVGTISLFNFSHFLCTR